MSAEPVEIVGEAVLRDFPLRVWARQQQHTEGVLREFELLVSGQASGLTQSSPPKQLLDLATMFTQRFGTLIDALNEAREDALAAGLDRIDSRVPLPAGTPELLEQVHTVMESVDEFCRHGDLLMLARPAEVVALSEWSRAEIIAQYAGAGPTPWPGPF